MEPSSPTKTPNHLAQETSAYLLEHCFNPVDWWPWGEAALKKARQEDKPIFLSIGYSACHWCHVMERECFENEAIAARLNQSFVSIKVDREERPDLDELYMTSVTAMTGSGGWPMSVFLTPALQPFYGGTYFPPEDRYGRPGFRSVIERIATLWADRREEVDQQAAGLTAHLKAILTAPSPAREGLSTEVFDHAINFLQGAFDARYGGWSPAPKFPSAGALQFLLRHYHRTGDKALLHQARYTLEAMARGGLYDHLGGGFHRYAVDERWRVPHFEKMLYDNAQLALVYAEAWQCTGDSLYKRVATATLDYLLRDMRDPGGGFYASEDADSEGEEGRFYLWTAEEIRALLGAEAAEVLLAEYGVREGGNFESHEASHRGKSILHLTATPDEALEAALAPLRARLLDARSKRARPRRDEKIITSWNALAITALARASRIFDRADYARAAIEAATFLKSHLIEPGGIARSFCAGKRGGPGYLDDYAFTINALDDLYEATFAADWLEAAAGLADYLLVHFDDAEGRRFYFASDQQDHLLMRTAPLFDGAEPSGNAVAAHALLKLGALLERPHYRDHAVTFLEKHAHLIARQPQGAFHTLCAIDSYLSEPLEIALIGDPEAADFKALLRPVYTGYLPHRLVAAALPDTGDSERLPCLQKRGMIGAKATAYICQGRCCSAPLTTPDALAHRLGLSGASGDEGPGEAHRRSKPCVR